MTTANPICILNSMNIEDCPYPLYPSDKFDCTMNTDNAYITPSNMCALIECSKCQGVFSVELFSDNLSVLTNSNNFTLLTNYSIKYEKFYRDITKKIQEYNVNYKSFGSCLKTKYDEMVDEFCAEFEVSPEARDLFKNLYDNATLSSLTQLKLQLAYTVQNLQNLFP